MIRGLAHRALLFLIIVLSGCTGMKHVTRDDPMYVGNEVKFLDMTKESKSLISASKSVLKPDPNNNLLWMRPAVARYNMISDSARIRKFWKNKISEPVLLSNVKPFQVRNAIHNRMFHNGYFQNQVEFDTVWIGKRKVKFYYRITLNKPYRFDSIGFPVPKDDLTFRIDEVKASTFLKRDKIYSLDAIKKERNRIDDHLKDKGFIFFNPEFILLEADSVSGDHAIKGKVEVKAETPPESRISYSIGKIFIHDDYSLVNRSLDTLKFQDYYLLSNKNNLEFEDLKKGIFLEPGKTYARKDHIQTIRYMNDLPIIRNTNLKFVKGDSLNQLDAIILLTQRKRFAYTAELNTVFRSTNYFGPGVIFSYSDRNLRKGSELMKINLRGRFEMQISDGVINPAYELGLEFNFTLPRFYPKFLQSRARNSLPKTNISFGYNLFNRLDLYRLNSVFADYGYRWTPTDQVSHSFNPVEIVFTSIPESSKSEEFRNYLEENPGVQRSFDEQFVVSMGYEFTYDPRSKGRDDFFFRGGLDMAGNILAGIYSLTNAAQDSLGRYKLLGVPFSQYARIRMDLRYGYDLNESSSLVTRWVIGLGIPFGNSDILPYIKQYFVGGTNSLRSFIARSVGPGSEVPPGGFNDLTGDIRLEWNLEYRFDISSTLKGALFMDAGNVWLYNNDPTRPNGNFKFDSFMEELAVSSGWGLRWDFNFLVARLDFAYTIRTPYFPDGERWIDSFNIFKPTVNIAFGYPF